MDVTVTAETFLHELSMVERAQPHSLITGVTLAQDTADVQCVTGPSVTVPLTAGRIRITQLLSKVAGPITPPAAQDPDTYPDTPAPQQLWSELLDDLGAYLPDLSHADPDLRLVSVHRDGATARIQVANSTRQFTHGVPLDSGEMPAAVTVDIAAAFAAAREPLR